MKYTYLSSLLIATTSVVFVTNTANAATFTGYDENTGTTPLTSLTSPNSQAAFNNFSAQLNGVGITTESFETTPVGTAINGLVKTISGTNATFSYIDKGTGLPVSTTTTTSVQQAAGNGFTNAGTYPTDGVRGISINSANTLSINFSNPLAAFGYFGTDLGDGGNVLTMNFFNGANQVNSTPIVTGANSANSSEYFFGFIANNSAQYFDKVVFSSSINGGGDAIGIDQIKIGTPAQLAATIPEPAHLLGTIVFGGSVVILKRKQKITRSTSK